MVIIDTSVIIDHLRQSDTETETFLQKLANKYPQSELGISVITIQELYESKSTLNKEKENFLFATISPLKVFAYNYSIAEKAGQIARDLTRNISFADVAIASTAINNAAKLATLNYKDFSDIEGLETVEF